jgi:hypothetical protein
MNFINGRVYKEFSTAKLLRLKSFFIFCRSKFLVKNMQKLYNTSSMILGQRLTNKLINFLYGDIFLGGETVSELTKTLKLLSSENLICIVDYARESLLPHEEQVRI